MNWKFVLCGVLALSCVASDAFAGGFYLPGRGVKPNGRAGAYVASGGQNLNSIWYNPANLAGIPELEMTIDLALINLNFEFQRAPKTESNGRVTTFNPVNNEAPLKVDPSILIGGPFFSDSWTWAAGVYGPYLSGHTFSETGAQRYTLVDNDQSIAAYLNFALAWEVSKSFRVGFGVQWVPAKFSLVNVVSGYTGLFGRPEDPDLDILSQFDLVSLTSFGANFGMWWKVAPMIETGIALQSPIIFSDSEAKLTTRLPSHPAFNNAQLEGDTLSGSLSFPAVIRFGLRFVQESFDIEASFVYEMWSIMDAIDATPNDVGVTGVPGLGSIPVGPLTVPLEWKDTLSFRLGSDVELSEMLTVRGGYGYETQTVPDERYSVFLADGDKHIFALGASLGFGGWSIDATTSYYLIPERVIANSEVYQINPTDEANKITNVVGNGTYNQSYLVFGTGVNFAF